MRKPARKGARRAFVDQIEAGVATLLFDDESTARLPATLLPCGAKEGDWLTVSIGIGRAPRSVDAAERLRKRLSAKDDGKPFKL